MRRLPTIVALVLVTTLARAQDGTPFFDEPATSRAAPAPAVSVAPAEPSAPDLPETPGAPFGARGSVVVSTEASASVYADWYSNSSASDSGFSVAPAADYFFVRNVSLGLVTSFYHGGARGYGADSSLIELRSSGVYVGPRLGVNLPLGERFSFYPSLSFGLEWRRIEQEVIAGSTSSVPSPIGSGRTNQTGLWLELFLPLLFHPRPNAFIGVGPNIFHELARATGGPDVGGERTAIGGALVVGGHWGGAAAPSATATPVAPAKRFGDAHHVLLRSSASATWTTYGGTSSSTASIDVSPGVDYFIGSHVAIGFGAGFYYRFDRGLDAQTGTTVTSKHFGGGGAMSVAYDVRVTDWFSVYPRATLSLGLAAYDALEATSRNRTSDVVVEGELFVPLLLHVVPHVALGAGPYVNRDFVRESDPRRARPILHTGAGAAAFVGVWL